MLYNLDVFILIFSPNVLPCQLVFFVTSSKTLARSKEVFPKIGITQNNFRPETLEEQSDHLEIVEIETTKLAGSDLAKQKKEIAIGNVLPVICLQGDKSCLLF